MSGWGNAATRVTGNCHDEGVPACGTWCNAMTCTPDTAVGPSLARDSLHSACASAALTRPACVQTRWTHATRRCEHTAHFSHRPRPNVAQYLSDERRHNIACDVLQWCSRGASNQHIQRHGNRICHHHQGRKVSVVTPHSCYRTLRAAYVEQASQVWKSVQHHRLKGEPSTPPRTLQRRSQALRASFRQGWCQHH